MGDRVSVIADVRYNRVERYSRKYTIAYAASTRNKLCGYIEVFILLFYFILNNFITKKPCRCLKIFIKIYNYTQPDFVRYIRVWYNKGLLYCILLSCGI
jgi:hypothetical protein